MAYRHGAAIKSIVERTFRQLLIQFMLDYTNAALDYTDAALDYTNAALDCTEPRSCTYMYSLFGTSASTLTIQKWMVGLFHYVVVI